MQNKDRKENKKKGDTKQMLIKRREIKQSLNKHAKIEYVELCKTIRKRMRDEIRKYNVGIIEQAIRANKGLKAARLNIRYGKRQMVAIKAEDGTIITDRNKIVERCAEFYSKLYASQMTRPNPKLIHENGIQPVLGQK